MPVAGSPWKLVGAVAVIVLATVGAYRNSLSGPFVFDDAPAIVSNPTIRSPLSLGALLSPPAQTTAGGRPLVNATLAFNYAIGGTNPWSYHALNLLIHIGAGLTLFGVVRRTLRLIGSREQGARGKAVAGDGRRETGGRDVTTGLRSPASGLPAANAAFLAFAIALLWTLHPLQTEAVTYIVQRTESLMGLCYLLTLYCFIRAAEETNGLDDPGTRSLVGTVDPRPAGTSNPSPLTPSLPQSLGPGDRWSFVPLVWYSLSVLFCLLGMACKEVMVSAPLMVFFYDRTFFAGTFREAWRRRKRVYLGLAAGWLLLGWLVAGIGWNRGGTSGAGSGASFWAYALTQAPAVMDYVRLSFWPHPLVFDYGAEWVKDWTDVFLPGVAVIALVAGTVWALRRRSVLGFLGAWFFSILAPTSLVPGPRQTMADHRMYLALAAVIAVFVAGIYSLIQALGDRGPKDQETKRPKDLSEPPTLGPLVPGSLGPLVSWSLGPVVLALAVGFGWLTVARNEDYRSELSIWGDTAAKRPDNRWAQCNFGMALLDEGRAAEALPHLERGLKLGPDDPAAHNDLGMAFARLGRLDEAVRQYEAAVRLQPTLAGAHNNLGVALTELNRPADALGHLETALKLKPDLPSVYFNLGNALVQLGRLDEAIKRFQQAIKQNPNDASACANLGTAFAQMGEPLEAIKWCEKATELDPNDATAHYNLGMMLARAGRVTEAVRHFQAVLRLRPNDAGAREALLQLQAMQGGGRFP